MRGDQQSEALTPFVSAPTASREFLRLAAICFVNDDRFQFHMTDISKAFTQSSMYHPDDRVFAIMPSCVRMRNDEWEGELYLDNRFLCYESTNGSQSTISTPQPNTHGILLYRPLYGTRDAPMRWYCEISTCLIRHKFFPLNSDACIFTRFRQLQKGERGFTPSASRILTCMIMLHVDDIICVSVPSDFQDLIRCVSEFKHSPCEELSVGSGLTFCGIDLSVSAERSIHFSQEKYYSKIPILKKEDLISRDNFRFPIRQIQRKLKAYVGACLWATQTRFDLSFGIAELGSSLADALTSVSQMKIFVSKASRIHSRMTDQHVDLTFVKFIDKVPRFPQFFSFPDASFGTLRAHGSIESNVLIMGVPISRDGIVECMGSIVSWHCRRIGRVCRSTAQAEGIALSNSTEITLFFQILATELFTGDYETDFLRSSLPCEAQSPFKIPLQWVKF